MLCCVVTDLAAETPRLYQATVDPLTTAAAPRRPRRTGHAAGLPRGKPRSPRRTGHAADICRGKPRRPRRTGHAAGLPHGKPRSPRRTGHSAGIRRGKPRRPRRTGHAVDLHGKSRRVFVAEMASIEHDVLCLVFFAFILFYFCN